MTKADVLDPFSALSVCTGYRIKGEVYETIPFQMTRHQIEPVLHAMNGWNTPTSNARAFADLPPVMLQYIDFINRFIGVNISHISNGPEREQIITV